MKSKVDQRENVVHGHMAGRDVNISTPRTIAKVSIPIRIGGEINLTIDSDSTTLMQKLKDGKLNSEFTKGAIRSKTSAISIIIGMSKTKTGKQFLTDIYDNLLSIVRTKYISIMDDGDLLKLSLPKIQEEFAPLAEKYSEVFEIDEAFIEGLLYIATSNCALRWKIGEAS